MSVPKKKNLADIQSGLKLRGVTDDQIEQFMEELNNNEYDYDAILEDVSDREQSMLLDFFRDELNDESLFDKLMATINDEPIKEKAPPKEPEKTPSEPEEEKIDEPDPELTINNSPNKPTVPKKKKLQRRHFTREDFQGVEQNEEPGTVILNAGLIIIPDEVLLDEDAEFLEHINGLTYILKYNNAKPLDPPRLPYSYIKFWNEYLQEENPTYKQIAEDISQNEGPTYDYLMENPPNDRILPVLEKIVDQLKYPKLDGKKLKNKEPMYRKDILKFFRQQTPQYYHDKIPGYKDRQTLPDSFIKCCVLFKKNTDDRNFNVFELFINVLDVYDRIIYQYPQFTGKAHEITRSGSIKSNKNQMDIKAKHFDNHFAKGLGSNDMNNLNQTILDIKDPKKGSFFASLAQRPNTKINDSLKSYQLLSLSFMLFIKAFMCESGNYLEQGYHKVKVKKKRDKKKKGGDQAGFKANTDPLKPKNKKQINDDDIFFHNDNMPLQFDFVILSKETECKEFDFESKSEYAVIKRNYVDPIDDKGIYKLYGDMVEMFRKCIKDKANEDTEEVNKNKQNKKAIIKRRDDRYVIVISKKDNVIYLYPPNIDNGGKLATIDHRKKINTIDQQASNVADDANASDDKSGDKKENKDEKDNRFSLIAHEYNDNTNWYLTSKCLIPSNVKNRPYFGVDKVEFCLSAHYHKQRQWHRHPKLRLYQYFFGGGLRFFEYDMSKEQIWSKYFKDTNKGLTRDELQQIGIFDAVLDLEKCDAQYVQWNAAVRRQLALDI